MEEGEGLSNYLQVCHVKWNQLYSWHQNNIIQYTQKHNQKREHGLLQVPKRAAGNAIKNNM